LTFYLSVVAVVAELLVPTTLGVEEVVEVVSLNKLFIYQQVALL
jgi:hypothetical protein